MHVVNVIALYTQNSQKDKFYVMCFLLQLPEKKKKKAGVVVEATCATTSYSWIKSLVSTL